MSSADDQNQGPLHAPVVELDPTTSPPLSLYQSPWTISLAVAFIFRGTGTYVIDDIDNAGVERGKESQPTFRVVRKEVMSKKGWTNCRPLSAFCPDGLLFANLGRAGYRSLDQAVPLATLARHRTTTVERLIRDTSRRHGMWTLAGPDRAITAIPLHTARAGLRTIIARHEEAVCRTLVHEHDREVALKRLRHLMPDPQSPENLLNYFRKCLQRGLGLVGSDAPVLSAAREVIRPDGGRLFTRFSQQDPEAIAIYNQAAAIQGSRLIDPEHPLPYYAVGLTQGERVNLNPAMSLAADQIIAPKVLVIEGVPRMALPRSTATRKTIQAREHAYHGLRSGSSQVFFDSTWLESLSECPTEVHIDELFQPAVGNRATMPLGELSTALLRIDQETPPFEEKSPTIDITPKHLDRLWMTWAIKQTLKEMRTWHYPVLMYAIAGDTWLERLSLRSYSAYNSPQPS